MLNFPLILENKLRNSFAWSALSWQSRLWKQGRPRKESLALNQEQFFLLRMLHLRKMKARKSCKKARDGFANLSLLPSSFAQANVLDSQASVFVDTQK